MLLSMTGHGQAMVQDEAARVLVEVRSVNNRFLKVSVNGELDSAQLSELENIAKQYVNRGSVNLRLKVQLLESVNNFRLNETAIKAYSDQLRNLLGDEQPINIASLLQLPGTVEESAESNQASQAWPLVRQAVEEAFDKLTEMRTREGQFMTADMSGNCDVVEQQALQIEKIAPRVVDNYSRKITDRINQMLAKFDVSIQATDVVREVGIFAERVDVSEEIVRLKSHVEQFRSILNESSSNGRKLDFLTQEMLRETNTVGSKANDYEIASRVVEIKSVIERIREMVQNVE